jgi:hypothetical protein
MRERPDELERRWQRVRRALRLRHAGIEADAGFAGRVVARLPARPPDALGWAAGRLLPVGLALALALGWLALRQTAAASSLDPVEALGSWVVAGLVEAE